MEDMLRIYGMGLLHVVACAVLLLVLYRIFWYVFNKVYPTKDTPPIKYKVKWIAWGVIALFWAIYTIETLMSLSVNVTPRGIIDRSQVLDQQKAFEQKHTQGEVR